MRNKLIRYSLSIIIAFSSFSLLSCNEQETSSELTSIPIFQDNIKKTVKVKGVVKPFKNENIVVPMRVWGTIENMVPEGTKVKKGDFVAKINVREYIEDSSRHAERLATSEIQAKKEQANLPLEIMKLEMQHKNKLNSLKTKEIDSLLIQKGPKADVVKKAERDINVSELKLSSIPLEKKQELYKKGYIPQEELNNADLDYKTYETQLKTSIINKEQLSPEYQKFDIEKAKLTEEQASLDLEINDIEKTARKSSLKVKARNSEFKVRRYKSRYNKVLERIERSNIYSPIDGIVIYPKIWGWKKPSIGMEVWSGFSFLNIAEISKVKIEAKVNELDIKDVKEGQQVEITVNSLPERIFKGEVVKVSKLAKYLDERNPEGLKYFDVDIVTSQELEELKVNMNVDLNIVSSSYNKTFYVPLDAIVKDNEKNYVFFNENNNPVKKEVKIKDKTKNYAILDGNFSGKEKFYLVVPEEA